MNSNKNVILVGPLLQTGGVTKYVKDLLNFESDYRYVLFNSSRPAKNITTKSTGEVGYKGVLNAGVFRFISGAIITIFHMIYFPFFLLKNNAKIVHICGVSFSVFWENAYYIYISKLFGKKVFLHYLGAFDLYYNSCKNFEKGIIKTVLLKVDRIALLSNKVKQLVETFIPNDRLFVLPSTVNVDAFINEKRRLKSLENNHEKVLFVGGQDPFRKGLADIIKAIPIVLNKTKDICFVLAGGENVMKVRPECNKLGIESYINFWGWINDEEKIRLYNSVDMLILPSYNEGLPYVIIEALAAGLPIISTPIGGIPEAVIHNENGFIIPVGDYKGLAKSIVHLSQNPELLQSISDNNRQRAIHVYSLRSVITRISGIYESMVVNSI